MDENTSAGTGSQKGREIPWRLIGFIIAAVLALIFLRERLTRTELAAMGITIAGAGLLAI